MKHTPKKHLGQHFLTDKSVIDKMIRRLNVQPDDILVEIGPGQGALTHALSQKCEKLYVIEFDAHLIEPLQKKFPNVTVIHADALTYDFASFSEHQKIRLIGNLPYYISTPLIFHFLDHASHIQDMHLMLQKEVVDRICALPGSKTYGRLSVMVQYQCQAQSLFYVPKGAFQPPPQVDSAVFKLLPYHDHNPFGTVSYDHLNRVVTQAFSKRRKTIRNALKELIPETTLEKLDVPAQARPETLSVEQFVLLAQSL